MNVKRMLLLAGMALAAIAFAAPASAGAFVQLTHDGVALEPGEGVTVTSSNLITTTTSGTLECTKVTLHYEVEVNGEDHVVLQPIPNQPAGPDKHNGTTEGCVLNVGVAKLPAHIKTAGTGEATINTWGTLTTNATFNSEITSPQGTLNCEFAGTIPAQWSHAANSDIVTVETGNILTGSPSPPCAANGEMHGDLTVETSNGEALQLDFVKTT